MKKIFYLLVIVVLCFSITGCGNKAQNTQPEKQLPIIQDTTIPESGDTNTVIGEKINTGQKLDKIDKLLNEIDNIDKEVDSDIEDIDKIEEDFADEE